MGTTWASEMNNVVRLECCTHKGYSRLGTTWANKRIDWILGHNIALIKTTADWGKPELMR